MKTYALALGLALAATGCTADLDPSSYEPDANVSLADDPVITDDAVLASKVIDRAEEWVDAKLHYCQAPNHERDYDSACSTYCERENNSAWNPYRSDCSGFVSWAWGLDAPGRTTLQLAPFRDDITHTIDAIDLQPGDAINNADHIMLFKAWTNKGHVATFLEEPGCSSATPYAHQVTVNVSITGTHIYVPYNGMTFTAIRFDGISHAKPLADEADRIGVSSWGAGRIDLFARDAKQHLRHRYYANHSWSAWETRGDAVLKSAPAAVSWAEGRIDVFARGANDHLVHKWFDGQWHDFEDLGGDLTSAPSAVSMGERSLDVFVRDSHDKLAHKYYRKDVGWSGWQELGGDLAGTPAATVWKGDGRIDVFARTTDDNLIHIQHEHGAWTKWMRLDGGPIHVGPAATAWADGRIDLFGTESSGKLIHRWLAGGTWHDWQSLGGDLDSPPTAVSWGPERIDVFARGGEDIQDHRYFDGAGGNGWSAWEHQAEMPQ